MQQNKQDQRTELEFVCFFAGGQSFSIDITNVREIRRWSPVTPLPHAPSEVLGVMNLRGFVIPIYDLAACFGLRETIESVRNVIMVATHQDQTVGLLVESVSEILSVARDQIQSTPDVRSESVRQNISGIITLQDGMTRVVDLAALVQPRLRAIA
jgi:purine-binding chemotaxis protein CheW